MKLCKHLNYCKSLSPGKAVFFYKTTNSEFIPLRVDINKINGQKSGYAEAFSHELEPKNIQYFELAYGNPHTIETCYVPPNIRTVYCRFSLRVEANSLSPHTCSDIAVRNQLTMLATEYKRTGGYQELAKRYAMNILMGTWLWRNKATLGIAIEIRTSLGTNLFINDSRHLEWMQLWPPQEQSQLELLANELSQALCEPSLFWFCDITAALSTSFCQEIHPSQLFTDKGKNKSFNEPSKQLATVECIDGQKAASFNSQKIGAAIQLIDNWWADDADTPLRVHEYAADKKNLTALRHPVTQKDFYHLLSQADELITRMKSLPDDTAEIAPDIHFIMAVLCKGGLFQGGKQ